MRLVIAGGTGLIGRELVNDIAEEGYQITILSRSPKNYRHMFSETVELVCWDGRSAGEWVSPFASRTLIQR